MGAPTERAEIRFADDGHVEVLVGTQSAGQGHETGYIQLTAEQLGIPQERIRVLQGDSDAIPMGGGKGGSRSLYSEGQAILATAESVIGKGKRAASDALEAAFADIAFENGAFGVVGTNRRIDILSLTAQQRAKAAAGEEATLLDTAGVASVETHTFPNGCHLAEVEVDPETGAGEAGTVGSPPAVMNAVLNAMAGRGVTHLDMPATPEIVWRALASAEAA